MLSWRGGDAERYKSQTRDETFVSEASFLGPPESYARMGRGGDTERCKSLTRDETFVSEASLPNASAKLLLFFDMAMGWSGLRAVLVRIACMCPND